MAVRFRAAVVLLAAAAAAGCSPNVDLRTALQVTDVTTGWFDAGIVNGQNKLVPSLTFRLKNVSQDRLRSVQLNAVFDLLPDNEEWDAMLTQGISSDGLAPDTSTNPITVRANVGFTGQQPRAEMLQHRLFRDARVRLFGKHGSTNWVPLGEFDVDRRLLTQ
jgi:hypothetical protein